MNEQPDTRYPLIAPTQQAFPTRWERTGIGIPPPPPNLTRRSARAILLIALLIILVIGMISGTALLFYHLGSTASLAHQPPPRGVAITPPVVRLAPSINAVIAAIKRQPRNDVVGNGVSYGESIANWYFGSYPDIVSSLSSATWSYNKPSYIQGPCCPPDGVFVYATTAQAMREYTAVEQISVSFDEGTPIPNNHTFDDMGTVDWTLDGYCLAGNISTTDVLALPAICG